MTDPSIEIMTGAEPWSYTADTDRGALVLHGFTGNPGSMRGLAEAFADAGYHVEMPRLPGHGTTIEDMLTTNWSDWSGEAEAAYRRLASRTRTMVVAGLSMGGALTLWIGGQHPDVAGLVCINPATQPQDAAITDMLAGLLEAGTTVTPGIGSDIADPNAKENAYEATPVAGLLSFVTEGLATIAPTYESMRIPLLLLNSPQDHVVEPAQAEFLATHYGGPLERVTLERSFHVATQDYDKDLIFAESVAFANRLTG